LCYYYKYPYRHAEEPLTNFVEAPDARMQRLASTRRRQDMTSPSSLLTPRHRGWTCRRGTLSCAGQGCLQESEISRLLCIASLLIARISIRQGNATALPLKSALMRLGFLRRKFSEAFPVKNPAGFPFFSSNLIWAMNETNLKYRSSLFFFFFSFQRLALVYNLQFEFSAESFDGRFMAWIFCYMRLFERALREQRLVRYHRIDQN